MPVVEFNTKADFDSVYSIGMEPDGRPNTRPEVRLQYHRASMFPYSQYRAQKLVELFAWPTATKILIVGSGFGWTAEALETSGYTNVVGIDTSAWIQTSQDTSEETEINAAITAVGLNVNTGRGSELKGRMYSTGNRRRSSRAIANEGMQNNGSQNRVRSLLNGVQVGISEDVLPALSDAEIVDLGLRINLVDAGVQVIHLVTTGGTNQDPRFNWHTLAEYKLLIPSDTFIDLSTWEVL